MSTCQSTTIARGPACRRIAKVADPLQSLFLLVIRAYIGYQCMMSGWGHLHNFQKTASFFRDDLHIPMATVSAAISGGTELVGGALLILGLGSRFVALLLAGNFFVAMLSVQLSNYDFSMKELGQNIWNNQDIFLKDTAFPFFATAVIVLLFGPGWFSLDGLISCFRRKPKAEV